MILAARWVVHAVILWAAVLLGQNLGLGLKLEGWGMTFLTVLLLALANAVVRPAVKTLLLPLNCLTFGLLGFLLNVLVILALDYVLRGGFDTGGFWGALYLSVMLGLLGGMANKWVRLKGRKD